MDSLVFFYYFDYYDLGMQLGKGNHHQVHFEVAVQLLNSSHFIC